ncbi:hypothetical protein ACEPAF_3699 [Sanghuangporus sanghuang]
MFSFRNVMENIAQPQPQTRTSHPGRSESQEVSPTSQSTGVDRQHSRGSPSFDLTSVAQSTSHLAESAFSNLRKSLAAQRPFNVVSPSAESARAASTSPQSDRELKPVSKPNLEDRLRASFTIGDISGSPTPDPSHAPSPKPQQPAANAVLSPPSTPLPDSPPTSFDLTSPLQSGPQSPPASADDHPLAESLTEISIDKSPTIMRNRGIRIALSPTRSRYPEADVPLPLASPVPTNLSASQSSQQSISPLLDGPLQTNGEVEDLKTKLQQLEAQFRDVSATLENLTKTRDAVNVVLAELTPLPDISDLEGLRTYLQNLSSQRNSSEEEIKRLNGKLSLYDERIEELRDTHRLEGRSQIELVDNLRKQLEESEALLKAAQAATSQAQDEMRARQADAEQASTEAQKLKDIAKEEEEKRVKAISLLKTVRQKLVKTEKERDEAAKEVESFREKERASIERERSEKARLEKEVENVRAEKERDIAGLKSHFDRELSSMKERLEKEFSAREGQIELEVASTKASLQKEISTKNVRIQALENSVRSLSSERNSLFDQLQLREAEVESSQSMLESLQSSTAELQFQLREAADRNSLLAEELADAQRELEYRTQRRSLSREDTARIRASTEAKYKASISELTSRLAEVERDRNDMEAVFSRNLQQKTQEIEVLKKTVEASSRNTGPSEEEVMELRQQIDTLRHEVAAYKEQVSDLDRQKDIINDLEAQLQRQSTEFNSRSEQYERENAEAKERERQVRAANKTLREELRKVQSSATLLERQRNPGVGYWSSITRHDNSSEAVLTSPSPSTSELPSSPRVGSPAPASSDEEINLEYLRNVILQFLEHKEMRALRSPTRRVLLGRAGQARTFFAIIHQGYEGWRLSFGRNPVKLNPGLRLMIPVYHTIQEVDMRETSVNIKDLTGFTSDNVPVLVSGSLFFRVKNSYDACFSVSDFQKNVANIGTSAIRSVIGHFTYDEVIGDRNKINQKLHEVIGESISRWGVACTRFEIQNFHPSNRDVEKQLELQMAAERERRKQILDTQAQVNVAEGHKQRAILESEGKLQATLNTSAGQKQKLILESEGHLEAAKNEGLALARQVDILAQSLVAEPSASPTDEDKRKALDTLLELRRLEQLKAIAAGHGNSTYFFGDAKGTGRDAYDVENVEKWKRSLSDEKKFAFSSAGGGII